MLNPTPARADQPDMSDLSRLLEDVYGDGGAVYGDGSSPPPAVPDWSSDEALDDTFASWVPGPPADAPAAERAFAVDDTPVRERPTFDEVFAAFGPEDASELVAEVEVEAEATADTDALVETEVTAVAEIPELDDLLGVADLAGFTEAFTPAAELAAAAPEPIAAPPIITRWMPSDDDILPAKGSEKKRRVAQAKSPKPLAAAGAPKARFQRSRKAAAPGAPVELAAAEADTDVEVHTDLETASLPVAVEPAARRSFRRPAPKHAKPKARLQLTRRGSGTARAEVEAPAAEATPTRRGFRTR